MIFRHAAVVREFLFIELFSFFSYRQIKIFFAMKANYNWFTIAHYNGRKSKQFKVLHQIVLEVVVDDSISINN